MACPMGKIFKCFVAKPLKSTRFLSIQSCKFARGSRLTSAPSAAATTTATTVNHGNIIPAMINENVESTQEIIDLGDTLKMLDKSRKNEIHTPKQQMFTRKDSNLPFYEKLGDSNDKFSSNMLLMKSKKERERKSQILLEGHRLIQDALDAGIKPRSVFFSQKELLAKLKIPVDTKVDIYKIQYKQLQLWSTLTTSPGLVGVFETPSNIQLESLGGGKEIDELPITLVCDNIREPGNLGAVLRVAAGVGCRQILLTKGCVDLWEPKVLRSSAGALFRVPVIQKVCWESLTELVHLEKASVYLADSRGGVKSSRDYCDMDFCGASPVVLILGGETEGLSREAKQLSSCAGIHIPLAGGVDSLNVATALAVILFEMRRQKLAVLSRAVSENRM